MLAPHYEWWKKWKDENLSNDWYIEQYVNTVLSKLDVHKVAKDLDGKILLCYESSEKFCHRHIVSEWFRNAGYESEEIQ